jgi:outer membrane protein W
MRRSAVVLMAGLAWVLLAAPSALGAVTGEVYFGDQPPGFAVSFRGSLHSIDGIEAGPGSYFPGDLGFDTDWGYGLALEYWITPAISIELAFDHVKIEDTFGAARTVGLGISDWGVSGKYTFLTNARLRPYVLAGLDAFTSSVDFGGTGIVLTNGNVGDTWGWHVGGGAEYRFTDNLGFFAEIRYRSGDTDIEVTQWFSGIPALTTSDTLTYDGFVGTIGIKVYW